MLDLGNMNPLVAIEIELLQVWSNHFGGVVRNHAEPTVGLSYPDDIPERQKGLINFNQLMNARTVQSDHSP